MVRIFNLDLACPSDDLHTPIEGMNVSTGTRAQSMAKTLLRTLGPGLITGAADDDPSGIVTYSQVGAQFGFAMLWTMVFSFPLMAAIQEICARLGRITGSGITVSLRKRYSGMFVYGVVALM